MTVRSHLGFAVKKQAEQRHTVHTLYGTVVGRLGFRMLGMAKQVWTREHGAKAGEVLLGSGLMSSEASVHLTWVRR